VWGGKECEAEAVRYKGKGKKFKRTSADELMREGWNVGGAADR
jgi:hypothetical protein